MSTRRRLPILLVALLGLVGFSRSPGAQPGTTQEVAPRSNPAVTVLDASPTQIARLGQAFDAFNDAELELLNDTPPLEIRFFETESACGGTGGRFRPESDAWHVRICSPEFGVVFEHELAHVWLRANVNGEERHLFMDMLGYANWSDHEYPWNERGVEGAAVVIQQGVSGLPLPRDIGQSHAARLSAYELLTGKVAPTLIRWLESREVPCDERPTAMSTSYPDENGRTCHRQLAG